MTQEELKDFVKAKFNLTETEDTSKQSFATATLEDGTKITNDKASEFADGDKVFVEVEGELKPAPAGDHITESGITITLDGESIIVGMKRPDEAGEGSEGLAEEEIEEKVAMAEEVIEEEIKMEEMPSLEEIVGVIAEVVEEKMMEIKEKMASMEEEMGKMKDKMSAFAAEPAEEKTIANKKFSKSPIVVKHKNEARYNKLLASVSNK
jgi:hypothetical protein